MSQHYRDLTPGYIQASKRTNHEDLFFPQSKAPTMVLAGQLSWLEHRPIRGFDPPSGQLQKSINECINN